MNIDDIIKQAVPIYTSNRMEDWSKIDELWKQVRDQYPNLEFKGNIGTLVGPGWWKPLNTCFAQINYLMARHTSFQFKVVQIKEKFGGLRFYTSIQPKGMDEDDEDAVWNETDEQHGLWEQVQEFIREAEATCAVTCETCGEPGTLRGGGWLVTACDVHAPKKE